MTLAKVYFPNSAHISVCNCIVDELKWFASGCLIKGGDFNISLNPLLDTSSGTTGISYRVLEIIKCLLHSLFQVDTWRTLYPRDKNCNFYTPACLLFSDYIFILQKDIPNLQDAKIGIHSLSDHKLFSLLLNGRESTARPCTWQLNPSLITDPGIYQSIEEVIDTYFCLNTCTELSLLTIWEAHKCVIRGEFFKWGSRRKKKQKKKAISDLSAKITRLETLLSLSTQSATELL